VGIPFLRRLRRNTFCSGDIVRSNDGALLSELQGNLAKRVNVKDFRNEHNITSSVYYFTDEALDVSTAAQSSAPASSGVVWVYRVPKPGVLRDVSLRNLKNQLLVAPGLDLQVSLMKSAVYPLDPYFEIDDAGDEILQYSIDTSAAAGDTTVVVGYGVESAPNVKLKEGDNLFLYSTYSIASGKEKIADFATVIQYGVVDMNLVIGEEHI